MDERDIRTEQIGGGHPFAGSNDGMVWPTIRVIHVPTGLHAECSVYKSNVKNKAVALKRLEALLNKQLAIATHNGPQK